ncbi:hypothetical protein KL86CLO1_10495 [uncultured Eubacteriales bacterium]|uniref:Uncharacterized protein n=1 Tax=uncultured Eubacteriales bacterium TaxID=172733 RepID=A0A212J4C1_9FIRM|nr:hypothetical protein KL86CLO1_10495 [uncultured Eubacteriales bacterium]
MAKAVSSAFLASARRGLLHLHKLMLVERLLVIFVVYVAVLVDLLYVNIDGHSFGIGTTSFQGIRKPPSQRTMA